MADVVLVPHVLAAAAWLGGSLLSAFVGPRLARAGEAASLAWARVAVDSGAKYFNPAGILTALTGIGLVLVSEQYHWSDTFVSIGLGVVVANAVIAAVALKPLGTRVAAALQAGDPADAATNGKTAAIWGAVSTTLLIVAVVVMVLKTGSG